MKSALISALLACALFATSGATETFFGALQPPANSTTTAINTSKIKFGINAAPGEVCKIAQNMDLYGGDFRSIRGGRQDCCGLCSSISECIAYTWTDYQGGTCWLKNRDAQPLPKLGAESGIMADPSTPTGLEFNTNCDMPGNDWFNARFELDQARSCGELCVQASICKAVTWTDDNGGTCYFKTAGSECVYRKGAVSVVFFKA